MEGNVSPQYKVGCDISLSSFISLACFFFLMTHFFTPPSSPLLIHLGLASDLDVLRISKALKKTFKCNGSVTVDTALGEILQLSGDQRTNIRTFFVQQEVCHEDQIVIHGG